MPNMTLRPPIILLYAVLMAASGWAEERPVVVVSFSVLEDFAVQLAGPYAEVVSLVPHGAEVHEYELRPADFKALERADLVFYNGLALEQWMGQVRAIVGEHVPVVAVAADSGLETLPIASGDYRGEPDPHAWMDPRRASAYVDAMAVHLAELLPAQAAAIKARAEAYRAELKRLHQEISRMLDPIPSEQRVLISSEAAFIYFADAFDFFHDGIWGNNAESEGAPRQLMRIIDIIDQRRPAALFWESTVSSRAVETVSLDAGVPHFGPLYVDSLGEPGSEADNYPGMLRANARLLIQALLDDR